MVIRAVPVSGVVVLVSSSVMVLGVAPSVLVSGVVFTTQSRRIHKPAGHTGPFDPKHSCLHGKAR